MIINLSICVFFFAAVWDRQSQNEITYSQVLAMKARYNRKGTLSRYPSLLEGTASVQYRVPRFPARFASIGGPSPLGGIVKIGVFRT